MIEASPTDKYVLVLQHAPANVWVVKESELGSSDQQIHCRTYLGHLLCPGDVVLGLVQSVSLVNIFHRDVYCH